MGTTYQTMRRRKRRARRERATFFTILPTHGVSAAATLSHNVQREVIHVPIDYIYIYESRGVAYNGYNVPDNAEKEEGEKRESNLFHHTTRSRGNCRCDLEPQCTTGGYTCSHRLYLHIYIYIYREREREIYTYIYIYIYGGRRLSRGRLP